MTKRNEDRTFIVKIESYDGDQSFINCGIDSQDFVYAIVAVDSDGRAEIMDCGYRSEAEAIKFWPEAPPKPARSRPKAGK